MNLDQSLVIANIMAGGPGSGRKAECSHCGAQVKMSDGKIGQHSSKYHGEVVDDKCPGSGKAPGHNVVKADAEFTTTQVQGKKKLKADVDLPMPSVSTTTVKAGGPGSGRKPGSTVADMHSLLKQQGYKQIQNEKAGSLWHHTNGDLTVARKNGEWVHYKDPNISGKETGRGTSLNSLGAHLLLMHKNT